MNPKQNKWKTPWESKVKLPHTQKKTKFEKHSENIPFKNILLNWRGNKDIFKQTKIYHWQIFTKKNTMGNLQQKKK